ncbi:MAG: pilus assembly protein [Anaerolineales bacterium]|nr:pilus assembly protein [Anaerolineales bacterium]
MPKQKQMRSNEKGQSLVELAISLPVILLILLATFDFDMALFSYSILRMLPRKVRYMARSTPAIRPR